MTWQFQPLSNLELIYKWLIEVCGACDLKDEVERLFLELKKDGLGPSIDTITTYFQASGKTDRGRVKALPAAVAKVEEEKVSAITLEKERRVKEKLLKVLYTALVELPTKCKNPGCDNYIREEELVSAFPKSLHTYSVACPGCGQRFTPNLEVQHTPNKVKYYNFYFPPLFLKEVYNLIENNSVHTFFSVRLPPSLSPSSTKSTRSPSGTWSSTSDSSTNPTSCSTSTTKPHTATY